MGRFRLLALDIDGTLVNSRDELTPATSAGNSASMRRRNSRGLGDRSAIFEDVCILSSR